MSWSYGPIRTVVYLIYNMHLILAYNIVPDQWLQFSFGSIRRVKSIKTRGRVSTGEWVPTYKVQYYNLKSHEYQAVVDEDGNDIVREKCRIIEELNIAWELLSMFMAIHSSIGVLSSTKNKPNWHQMHKT